MKCKVCGKVFAPAPFHAFKIRYEQGYRRVCSWHCQRVYETERQEKRKREKEARELAWSYCEKRGRKICVGEICFEIGDDDYCADCCKRVDTRKEC